MKLARKDIGKRFRVKERHGMVVLVAVSACGTKAYVDTDPGARKTTEGRYEMVEVSALYRTVAEAKGERR